MFKTIIKFLLAICVCTTIGGILKFPLYLALYSIHGEIRQYIFEFCAVVTLIYIYYLVITKIIKYGKWNTI